MTYQYQPIDQARNIANKRHVMAVMDDLLAVPLDQLGEAVRAGYHADAHVNVTHPINAISEVGNLAQTLWQPLREALPDAERRNDMVAGGRFNGADWVGCFGNYVGTFAHDWLGIPATHGVVSVRFAEGHAVRDGKIAKSYVFIDFLDLMRQCGYMPIAPSLGKEMTWLPPMTLDGVLLSPQDDAISQRSIERVLKMHAALGDYDGTPPTRASLDKMQMRKHWHPNFMWYGPSGIGTSRGLTGFEDCHQIPFLVAFPDRKGDASIGHFIRIGDGNFAVTGGWGYLQATHTGDNFLGMPATGKRIAMRVMDFYRCDDVTICENWIPMDIPHMLLQMGIDVFGRMRHQFRQHNPTRVSAWMVTK
ncbi:MAG: ester cyclase [Anaerolineae bacterium]|nr:ester cyclase [Anaerolineae bacterium]